MVWRIGRFFWSLPKAHPSASTVITGILGIVMLIEGIALAVTTTTTYSGTTQSNVGGGIFVCLLGLVAVGLAAYATYDTQYFRNWTRPDGSYGHAVVRWAGPVLLIVALVEFFVVLWIISAVLDGMARK